MTREDQDFAQSQKSMIEQTMREYGGRFLFELIQNGYDTQPPGAENGRIAIVLADDEGLHGTLYVANTGRGFTGGGSVMTTVLPASGLQPAILSCLFPSARFGTCRRNGGLLNVIEDIDDDIDV
jgi:hypothetical protein